MSSFIIVYGYDYLLKDKKAIGSDRMQIKPLLLHGSCVFRVMQYSRESASSV